MKSPSKMRNLQIDITNACVHQCSNCTRFCGHHKKPYFMDFETFKKAVDSYDGWDGCVGIIGGEPTLHPEFEKFVEYLREKRIGKQLQLSRKPIINMQEHVYTELLNNPMHYRMGLWSTLNLGYYRHFEVINDSFDMQFLNDHDNKCLHQAILVSRKELGISDKDFLQKRDNCFAQNYWSATITPKGAFFCEVAAHLDMLFNGPGGWKIEKGWYNRTPDEFGDQLQWCEMCGLCLDVPQRISCDERDDITPLMLEKLKSVESPKIKRGKYVILSPESYKKDKFKSFKYANDYMDAGNNKRASKKNRTYYPKEFLLTTKENLQETLKNVKIKDWIIVAKDIKKAKKTKKYFNNFVINPGCLYKYNNCLIFNIKAKSLKLQLNNIENFNIEKIENLYPKDKVVFVPQNYKIQYHINKILKSISSNFKKLPKLLTNIFSIHNIEEQGKSYKVLTILFKTFKLYEIEPYYIVKLQGGLGNQMFQYAFAKSLEKNTNKKVYFDYTWFENKKRGKNISKNGINFRDFELKIFNLSIPNYKNKLFKILPIKKKIKHYYKEAIPNQYDLSVYEQPSGTYFEGYFQNEKYINNIRENLIQDFILPETNQSDEYNQKLISKIEECENPIFIHVRRGDYASFNATLNINYYQKAAKYMAEKIKNPKFFVFCAEDPQFIKDKFDIGYDYEFIGEKNKNDNNFYENLRLMIKCKHGILANSSYCWWAAFLSKNDNSIFVAPFPWIQDTSNEVIRESWIKIER